MEIETDKWDYEIISRHWYKKGKKYGQSESGYYSQQEWLEILKEKGKKGWEICGTGTGDALMLKRPCGKVRIVTRDQVQNNGYENER